jgi:tetratricopeptide (TPR) repeat protein
MDRSLRKNLVTIGFICIALFSAVLFAGNDEEFFLRGNNYYEKHDYDNALQAYDMISKKGRAVLYNMGNCLCQKGDYSQALVYWSRAEVGATPQECALIAGNKEYVLKKIGKSSDQSFVKKIKAFFNAGIPYFSLFFLQLFFLLCWYLFVFSADKKKSRVIKALLTCLFGMIMIIAAILGVYYIQRSTHGAIVTKKDALLFAGPDKGFHALSPVAYAETVIVKETRPGWHKIRYADIIGWVEADVIQII